MHRSGGAALDRNPRRKYKLRCCVDLDVGLPLLLLRGVQEPPRQPFRSVAVEHDQLDDSLLLNDLRPGRLTSSGLFLCARLTYGRRERQ